MAETVEGWRGALESVASCDRPGCGGVIFRVREGTATILVHHGYHGYSVGFRVTDLEFRQLDAQALGLVGYEGVPGHDAWLNAIHSRGPHGEEDWSRLQTNAHKPPHLG